MLRLSLLRISTPRPHNLSNFPILQTKLRPKTMAASYTTPSSSHPGSNKLLFRQLFEKESSTYTYLLADLSHSDKPALVCIFVLFLFKIFKYFSCNLVTEKKQLNQRKILMKVLVFDFSATPPGGGGGCFFSRFLIYFFLLFVFIIIKFKEKAVRETKNIQENFY